MKNLRNPTKSLIASDKERNALDFYRVVLCDYIAEAYGKIYTRKSLNGIGYERTIERRETYANQFRKKWSGNENLNSITKHFLPLCFFIIFVEMERNGRLKGAEEKAQQDIEQNDNSFPTDTFCTINSL